MARQRLINPRRCRPTWSATGFRLGGDKRYQQTLWSYARERFRYRWRNWRTMWRHDRRWSRWRRRYGRWLRLGRNDRIRRAIDIGALTNVSAISATEHQHTIAAADKVQRPVASQFCVTEALDCAWMLLKTLTRNENATTTEATASTTHNMENNNGRIPRRISRSAMRHTQPLNKAVITRILSAWRPRLDFPGR